MFFNAAPTVPHRGKEILKSTKMYLFYNLSLTQIPSNLNCSNMFSAMLDLRSCTCIYSHLV